MAKNWPEATCLPASLPACLPKLPCISSQSYASSSSSFTPFFFSFYSSAEFSSCSFSHGQIPNNLKQQQQHVAASVKTKTLLLLLLLLLLLQTGSSVCDWLYLGLAWLLWHPIGILGIDCVGPSNIFLSLSLFLLFIVFKFPLFFFYSKLFLFLPRSIFKNKVSHITRGGEKKKERERESANPASHVEREREKKWTEIDWNSNTKQQIKKLGLFSPSWKGLSRFCLSMLWIWWIGHDRLASIGRRWEKNRSSRCQCCRRAACACLFSKHAWIQLSNGFGSFCKGRRKSVVVLIADSNWNWVAYTPWRALVEPARS